MNCKQGDLAYIVNDESSHFKPEPENIGRVVRCLHIVLMAGMGPVWQIEAHGAPLYVYWAEGERDRERTAMMEDANLRPLSAEDQTVLAEHNAAMRAAALSLHGDAQ